MTATIHDLPGRTQDTTPMTTETARRLLEGEPEIAAILDLGTRLASLIERLAEREIAVAAIYNAGRDDERASWTP